MGAGFEIMSESSGHRYNTRRNKDNLSFNSQLSGAESGDGPAKSSRKKSEVANFFAGNRRSNYSMQVYLFVVLVVGLVLWFVIPAWFLFTVGAGVESASPDVTGLTRRMVALEDVMQDAQHIKNQKAEIETMLASMTSSGDGKSTEALGIKQAELEAKLKSFQSGKSQLEDGVKDLQTNLAKTQQQASAASGAVASLSDKVGAQLAQHASTLEGHQSSIDKNQDDISKLSQNLYRLETTASFGSAPSSSALTPERPNFALGCAGAKVVGTTAPDASAWMSFTNLVYQWTDIRLNNNNPPWQVLSSQNEPGQCWCFDGQKATITIKLLTKMVPEELFLHHIFNEYYLENRIDRRTAAPRRFQVVGMADGAEFPLGQYEYEVLNQKTQGLKQAFMVQENAGKWVDHVKIVFSDSQWNPSRKYTCVYQIGVHGKGSLE